MKKILILAALLSLSFLDAGTPPTGPSPRLKTLTKHARALGPCVERAAVEV
jgi:hypothetical protein